MESNEIGKYYVLTRDLCVNRVQDSKIRFDEPTSSLTDLLKGTILTEIKSSVPSTQENIKCKDVDGQHVIECNINDVDNISKATMELLIAISSCKERFKVFQNKVKLADGLNFKSGDLVYVKIPHQQGEFKGKLRYKGPTNSQHGIYFGIELIEGRGKGNSNGMLGNSRYFECPEDCGVFVALNRVSSLLQNSQDLPVPAPRSHSSKKLRGVNLPASMRNSSTMEPSSSVLLPQSDPVSGISKEELETLEVQLGMEVYIFTQVRGKESQERGRVKFMGRLPELHTNDIFVGIELFRASGNGRGVFNRRHLFKTEMNHAALVPLSGVLPAHTFDLTPAQVPHSTKTPESEYVLMHRNNTPVDKSTPVESSYHTRKVQSDPSNYNKLKNSEKSLSRRIVSQPSRRTKLTDFKVITRGEPDGGTLASDLDDYSTMDIYASGTNKTSKKRDDRDRNMDKLIYPLPDLEPIYPDSEFHNFFEVGSMVEISNGLDHLGETGFIGTVYGVMRWIGKLYETDTELMAGIELEMGLPGCTDGTIGTTRYFNCPNEQAMFIPLKYCRRDSRFGDSGRLVFDQNVVDPIPLPKPHGKPKMKHFGNFSSRRIPGKIQPPKKLLPHMIGKEKGIQGHYNSCYLDSTLFSMFAYSHCLDSILYRKQNEDDIDQYKKVQQVLTEDIVNPLRENNFVRADRVMIFRELLDELGSVTGLTNEEKDPEEFLQTLFNHVFKAPPLFELRQGDSSNIQECYFYQIFIDKDEKMVLPSTQVLLEQSFLASDLKFQEVPVCLIVQMPRFGKDYKMYNRVIPTLTLDVTDMVEKSPRSCIVCGCLAEFECKQCSIERSMQDHISSYCNQCAERCHQHPMRRQHKYKKIDVCEEYRSYVAQAGEKPVERHLLELYAVVCIETSHYVSFAKCGEDHEAKWCFFDSMADRVGEQSGYNIPQVAHCEQFEEWLGMDHNQLLEIDQKEMPEHMRRLLCDAYMCLYQSRDMMGYM